MTFLVIVLKVILRSPLLPSPPFQVIVCPVFLSIQSQKIFRLLLGCHPQIQGCLTRSDPPPLPSPVTLLFRLSLGCHPQTQGGVTLGGPPPLPSPVTLLFRLSLRCHPQTQGGVTRSDPPPLPSPVTLLPQTL